MSPAVQGSFTRVSSGPHGCKQFWGCPRGIVSTLAAACSRRVSGRVRSVAHPIARPGPPGEPRPGRRDPGEHARGLRPGPAAGRRRRRARRPADRRRRPGRPPRPRDRRRGAVATCHPPTCPPARAPPGRRARGVRRHGGQHRDQEPARRAGLRPRRARRPCRGGPGRGRRAATGSVVVSSFWSGALSAVRATGPPCPPGCWSSRRSTRWPGIAAAADLGCAAVHLPSAWSTAATVATAHAAGLAVAAWTVADEAATRFAPVCRGGHGDHRRRGHRPCRARPGVGGDQPPRGPDQGSLRS